MQRLRAFTLIEIVLVVTIILLMMTLALPSWHGLSADRKLRRSLDDLGDIVREAREKSVVERRTYLVVFGEKGVRIRPEALSKDEKVDDSRGFEINSLGSMKVTFPAALRRNPPTEWSFWPTGTCEPAIIEFSGRDGRWTAKYSGLAMEPRLTKYAAR